MAVLFIFMISSAYGISPEISGSDSSVQKKVQNINLDIIDVAGPSVFDGKGWQPDFIGEVGNFLHFKTRDWVIRNILLFHRGEEINNQKIEESERLLRKSGYFRDARIEVTNEKNSFEDVNVITKDKWTLNPQLSYSAKSKNGYFGIKDINLLGLGHSIEAVVTHDEDYYIGWGGKFSYTINNIKGSFVNAYSGITTNHKSNSFQFGLSRTFFTNTTEWAGGINFSWMHDDQRFIDTSTIKYIPNSFDTQDLWIGRSFPVWFGSPDYRNNSRFIVSAKYFKKHYRLRPKVFADSNRIFENHRLYLFSSGIINRQFYKSYFVDGFGVTEDIPVGSLISLTTGSDEREFYNRWYFGTQLIYSNYFENLGYFSGNFELGSFTTGHSWEQSTLKFDLNYHSPLFLKDEWKVRLFLQNNFIMGNSRFDGEQIYLDRNSGMPGFNQYSAAGTRRNVFNIEARIFSPYSLLGFVLGGIAFADYGLIAPTGRTLLQSKLYQSYGFGIRTQNESISRTKIEVALVFNPVYPSGKANAEIVFSASFVLGSRYINFDEPQTVNFENE